MGRVQIAVDRNAPLEAGASACRPLVERGRLAAAKARIPAFVFWLLVFRLVLEFGSWGVLSRSKVFLTLASSPSWSGLGTGFRGTRSCGHRRSSSPGPRRAF